MNPPEGIVAGPVDEENFFEWEALITYGILLLVNIGLYHIQIGSTQVWTLIDIHYSQGLAAYMYGVFTIGCLDSYRIIMSNFHLNKKETALLL